MSNKKQDIIETAFALFYEKGIHAVGINEIIKTASVAKKTLYNHFSSKETLILTTLEYQDQKMVAWLTEQLKQAEIGKDALLVLFEALDNWINNREKSLPEFRGCYFNNSCAEYGHTDKQLYQQCKNHKDSIKSLIKFHVESFETDVQKSTLLINTICLLKEGAITAALVEKELQSAVYAMHCLENLLRFKR